ncbi:diguanylate cyclase [Azospirillaceae bacterium]
MSSSLLQKLVERYELAERAGREGVWDWYLRTGRVYYSPRWRSVLGLSEDDVSESLAFWLDRVVPEDLIWLQATLEEETTATPLSGKPFQIEYRIRDGQSLIRWMVCRGVTVAGEDGRPTRIVGSQADITERVTAEQRLRQSEERYALAARGANDGLWDWRLDTGEVYYSPRWKEMLGHLDSEIGNRVSDWLSRVASEDLPGLEAAIEMHLKRERSHLEHEFRICHADGSERWFLVRGVAIYGFDSFPIRMAGSMTDITGRKKAELRLQFNAFHDGLTGLPNRALLLDRVGQSLDRQKRWGGRHFAVLLLDLDRFKSINDSMGASMGDLVLTTSAARLLRVRRTGDTLARLSADEFGILIEEIDDLPEALVIAHRFADAVARPFKMDNRDVVLTASIGVAFSTTGYEKPDDMLRDASLAMVRAKANGRARVEVFDSRLREHAMEQMRIESELRAAFEQGQLCLFYQPIVDMATRRIAGFEALMRWRHPERGLVPPIHFIPLAEETGLIVPFGRWALLEATQQIAAWQKRFPRPHPLFMSVNVSSPQFRDDTLLTAVLQSLKETGIPPSSLKLEITESVVMQNPEHCTDIMNALRNMDVRLSIDDFGTGYSSLSYLYKLPADTLKIDKSFVSLIRNGGENTAIVQVIASLASVLHMDVVAEGVEHEEEAAFLRRVSCKYGQGYLFARPAPADQIEALLVNEATGSSA